MEALWCGRLIVMASPDKRFSRPLRVGLLGATAAIGSHAARRVVDDGYLSSTVGGAAAAVLVSRIPSIGFAGLASVALIGAISGYAGRALSRQLAPEVSSTEDVPFRALLGLVMGGAVAAISADGISPPEIKMLE